MHACMQGWWYVCLSVHMHNDAKMPCMHGHICALRCASVLMLKLLARMQHVQQIERRTCWMLAPQNSKCHHERENLPFS